MANDDIFDKDKLKKNLLSWKSFLVLFLLLVLILGKGYWGQYVSNNKVNCGHYKELYYMDYFDRACLTTCAGNYGCTQTWNNQTYYNKSMSLCYCGGIEQIDFYCVTPQNISIYDPSYMKRCNNNAIHYYIWDSGSVHKTIFK